MAIPMVGASGAVFGILLAFGMMFPNQRIYVYFCFRLKQNTCYFIWCRRIFLWYFGAQVGWRILHTLANVVWFYSNNVLAQQI